MIIESTVCSQGSGSNSIEEMAYSRITPRKVSSTSVVSLSSGPMSTSSSIILDWEPVIPLGPKAAFHVGVVLRRALYIHGGILEHGSTQPSNQFYKMDLSSTLWVQVRTPGSPSLSHHAGVVVDDRYLILVGGWNGRRRTPDIHAYDAQEDQWLKLSQTGLPEGAGLSSHTACSLSNGEIIVVGREGSLRIQQRKHGNVYILTGNVLSGKFVYREYSHEATSRSGHSANIIGNDIYIIGGRNDKLLEKASGFKGHHTCTSNFLENILKTIESRGQSPMRKLPCGRKNHIAACDSGSILIHGGETFDGKSREPVGDMFFVTLKAPTNFYKLNVAGICRAGHVCFVLPERILFHGGISGRSTVHSDLYQLKFIA